MKSALQINQLTDLQLCQELATCRQTRRGLKRLLDHFNTYLVGLLEEDRLRTQEKTFSHLVCDGDLDDISF